jgi:hypothetical protein
MGTIIRKTMDEIRRERTESDRQLAMMEDVPDDQIDFSDIPASTDEEECGAGKILRAAGRRRCGCHFLAEARWGMRRAGEDECGAA